MTIVIPYIFGITVMTIYIYVAFISRTMNRNRYRYRIIFGIISLLIGILLDNLKLYNKPFGLFIILGISPLVYLVCY
jgi:uncharacterized membrane protein